MSDMYSRLEEQKPLLGYCTATAQPLTLPDLSIAPPCAVSASFIDDNPLRLAIPLAAAAVAAETIKDGLAEPVCLGPLAAGC